MDYRAYHITQNDQLSVVSHANYPAVSWLFINHPNDGW